MTAHPDRITFTGFRTGEMKTFVCRRTSVFVLVSAHENFGIAMFESAACVRPIVISRELAT